MSFSPSPIGLCPGVGLKVGFGTLRVFLLARSLSKYCLLTHRHIKCARPRVEEREHEQRV